MLTPQSKVGDILNRYPDAEKVFVQLGFTDLLNPVMRRTVAKFATLEVAAAKKKMAVADLIAALEKAIGEEDS
ncbi:MAG: DUF1858 domain-containing protein [Bacillota bacterium]|jgi:hypothetical protein